MEAYPVAIFSAAVVTTLATHPVIRLLQKHNVVDVAGHRSSHRGQAIRGVGIAMTLGFASGVIASMWTLPPLDRAIIGSIGVTAILVSLIGVVEDFRGLSISRRAGLQLLFGLLGCLVLFGLLGPSLWWSIPAGLAVAWYVNAANFMDGLNGMSGIHGFVAGGIYCVLGLVVGVDWLATVGGVVAIVFLLFLPWNFSPGGTFLGDSGSYLLGAALAFVAVATLASGVHPIVSLGPLVIYTLDTTMTLLRRILRGDRWHESHREHIYQRFNRIRASHFATSLAVGLCTLACGLLGFVYLNENQTLHTVGLLGMVAVCILYSCLPRFSRFRGEESAP